MLQKITHFIKYNNTMVLLILAVFVIGSGAFAATDAGQDAIGQAQTTTEGIDNILLLEADLDNFDMDYRIEKIEEDEKYYYVTYTFLNLDINNSAWGYQLEEKVKKVSRKMNRDLGAYLSEEFREEYEKRVKNLKEEQAEGTQIGETTRVELTEYSGLIGNVLDLTSRVFDGYEPVKARVLPTPPKPEALLSLKETTPSPSSSEEGDPIADSITEIYDNYIKENDIDSDDVFNIVDNCPDDYNPGQEDDDTDGKGNVCDFDEIAVPGEVASSTEPSSSAGKEQASSTEEVLPVDNTPPPSGDSPEGENLAEPGAPEETSPQPSPYQGEGANEPSASPLQSGGQAADAGAEPVAVETPVEPEVEIVEID